MPAKLKDEISQSKIEHLAELLYEQTKIHGLESNAFDKTGFVLSIIDNETQTTPANKWVNLSLMQRVDKVAHKMQLFIPGNYAQQLKLLQQVEQHYEGLFHFIFAHFVGLFGSKDIAISLEALGQFTQNSTSEFGIRPFIKNHPEEVKPTLIAWSKSSNPHLRRLSSEAIRPFLPWASNLELLVLNPDWGLEIIENLKTDPSRYVQKSLANLLNDLSKKHPAWVLNLIEQWLIINSQAISLDPEQIKANQWICKHALRTLLKQGNTKALAMLNYPHPSHIKLTKFEHADKVKQGDMFQFAFELSSRESLGLVRVEYALYFLRQTQPPYRKVFKVSESTLTKNYKKIVTNHNFKALSTRQYVSGAHKIEIIVNGEVMAVSEFSLQ